MTTWRLWSARILRRPFPPHPPTNLHERRPLHTSNLLHARYRPMRSSRQSTEPKVLNPTVTAESIGLYTDTTPPNAAQLTYVNKFFRQPASFLFASTSLLSLPRDSLAPEIAFLGRSNIGKSSLLNALMRRPPGPAAAKTALAKVSKRPGLTKEMNFFKVGRGGDRDDAGGTRRKGGLVVVDMPGYGFGSRDAWGGEILKFLKQRKQLRRVFVLVSSKELLMESDLHLLQLLYEMNVPHQIVLSKVDRLLPPGRNSWFGDNTSEALTTDLRKKITMVQEQVRELQDGPGGMKAMDDILACSAMTAGPKGQFLGMAGVRWAALQASGLDCDDSGNVRTVDFDVVKPDKGKSDTVEPDEFDTIQPDERKFDTVQPDEGKGFYRPL
ncbi:hypothetical protein P152DRAFT_414370 [Eremomyces bilateralis CBS 781.70]|uniref:EngB-type G domain-containing protein n=1 Tax=Eremomyces bilateralis CBS 781.70 TaxID=1392243 RepID=A0A6G1G774_9PEZI|nr:uncharacterized protein P152DRAFT_414370 [Eremomyces bilateralis CBS 781.70]KAF1813898.1 hypothetical protein P152DRAFT_414370 [Eremomyces bilateralis CBS 781.70]